MAVAAMTGDNTVISEGWKTLNLYVIDELIVIGEHQVQHLNIVGGLVHLLREAELPSQVS